MSLFSKLLATDAPVENKTLPSGYIQLEYLTTLNTSSAKNYINTGINATQVSKVKMGVKFDKTTGEQSFFGNRSSGNPNILLQAAANKWRGTMNDTTGWWTDGSITIETKYDIELDAVNGKFYADSSLIADTGVSAMTGNLYNLYIFQANNHQTQLFEGSIYYTEIYGINGTLIRNFIPAKRTSDNVLGMYDLVSNTFYTNAGTGTFTAGAEVKTLQINKVSYDNNLYDYTLKGNTKQQILPSGYTQLDYIQSSGSQYIDTGINPSNKKIGAIIDFQFTGTSRTTGGVFGSNNIDNTDNCQFTVYNSKWRTKINNYATYGTTYNTSRHIARCNMPDGTSLDSTIYTTTQYTIASTNTNNVYVGACNYNNSSISDYTLVGKLYSAKVYDDTTLVRDFIPAKNSSNVIGMYDLVTNQFFTNAGTGEFTAGSVAPTPTAPIEIKSVGGKTENLTNYILNVTATGDGTQSPIIQSPELNVNWKENTQYTFSLDCAASNVTYSSEGNLIFFSIKYTDNTYTYTGIQSSNYRQGRISFTTTANKTVESIMNIVKHARWTGGAITISNLQIEEGTTATSYQPYGYKVPVINGSNCGVVDLGTLNWILVSGGTNIFQTANGQQPSDMKFGVGGSLPAFYCLEYTNATHSNVLSKIADRIIGENDNEYGTIKVYDTRYTDATVFKQAMSGVYLYYQRTTDDTWTAPTTTNIYLTKPLPKLGNKQDSINYKNQTLTMGTSYYEFTGNETFTSTYSTQFGYVFTCANILSGVQTSATASDMLCTHFRNSGASTDIKFSFTSGTNLNFAVQTTWTSTSDFKAWLTAQKTANTPVTIYYPLQNDVTISVTTPTGGVALPAIPVKSGSNTLEVNTSVTPSEVDATAWCWRF